jgi:hypothetical protein
VLATSSDGTTSGDNTVNGVNVYREMGINWVFWWFQNANFEFAKFLTNTVQPYLLTAQGNWNAFAEASVRNGLFRSPGPGVDGHGVVVYDYDDSLRTILVCLGWGNGFPDKMIAFDQYDQTAPLVEAGADGFHQLSASGGGNGAAV